MEGIDNEWLSIRLHDGLSGPIIALAPPSRGANFFRFLPGVIAALNPRLISGTPPECLASLDDARPGRQIVG